MKSVTSYYTNVVTTQVTTPCHNVIHKNLDCKMAVLFLEVNAYSKKNSK